MPLSKYQKLWLSSCGAFSIANSLTSVFLSFYILKSTSNIHSVIIFHLFLFISIPIFAVLASFICKVFSASKTYFLASLLNIIVLLSTFSMASLFIENLWFFGVVTGLSVALFGVSANLINQQVSQNHLEQINSRRNTISALINIIFPTLIAFSLSKGVDFVVLFMLGSLLLAVSGIFAFLIHDPSNNTTPNFHQALFQIKKEPNLLHLFPIYFLHGIKDGVLWGIGPIIALSIVGNYSSWGLYILAFSLISVGTNLLLTKVLNLHRSHSFIITSGILFSLTCVIFGANFSFVSFLWYSLFLTIDVSITNSAFISTATRAISSSSQYQSFKQEYFAIYEFPVGIGRSLPLLLLIISHSSGNIDLWLRIIIISIGCVSLLIFSRLGYLDQPGK